MVYVKSSTKIWHKTFGGVRGTLWHIVCEGYKGRWVKTFKETRSIPKNGRRCKKCFKKE